MLLLLDERRPPPPPPRRPEPRHLRLPYRVLPSSTAAVALYVVAATGSGPVAALSAIGSLIATFRALDRALPYKQGLREHRP